MIIVGGKEYKTLNDKIYVDGTQVKQVFVNGTIVYPENKFHVYDDLGEFVVVIPLRDTETVFYKTGLTGSIGQYVDGIAVCMPETQAPVGNQKAAFAIDLNRGFWGEPHYFFYYTNDQADSSFRMPYLREYRLFNGAAEFYNGRNVSRYTQGAKAYYYNYDGQSVFNQVSAFIPMPEDAIFAEVEARRQSGATTTIERGFPGETYDHYVIDSQFRYSFGPDSFTEYIIGTKTGKYLNGYIYDFKNALDLDNIYKKGENFEVYFSQAEALAYVMA